ncbi:MAG: response regulator [Acidobacteria bacterium]|nr:response regulator [Acidobacteriota bacterium]
MDDVFLTTEEVLEYLQVNLRTVYRLIKAGKIPAVRVGRQWRFRKTDIDRWLTTQATAFPVTDPSAAGASATEAGPLSTRRRRVLVVDDEATIRELLTRTLLLAEYDVEEAPDGRAALALMRTTAFDLLITDLKMPGVDGLALIRDAHRLAPTMPAIVITGHSTEASAIDAANVGVAGYPTKPFRIARVLATVAKALGE